MSVDSGILPLKDPSNANRVQQTLLRIAEGVKTSSRDGIIFYNREAALPPKPPGYYHEYTVVQAAETIGRGSERLVIGDAGEVYYSPDHYGSFVRIQ